MENRNIDTARISASAEKLSAKYDNLIIEGAGGLFVPLTEDYLVIDYIKDNEYPVVLVTTPKLGSINHTLLSIEALASRGIELRMLVYNLDLSTSKKITDDTLKILKRYLLKYGYAVSIIIMDHFSISESADINFDSLLRL